MQRESAVGTFGQWLKQQRKARGMTQAQLAEVVGCATVTVKRVETGTVRPSQQLVECLLTRLEVPPCEWAPYIQTARGRPVEPIVVVPPHLRMPALRNPYKGLLPFTQADAADFFGRSRAIQEVLTRLRLHPFLAVIGPSGSGKSSLVQAGVVPALPHSSLFPVTQWVTHVVQPGAHPLTRLQQLLGCTAWDLEDQVRSICLATDPPTQLLLVVDPFEETFTLAQEEALPFQQALQQLSTLPHCCVILTIRANAYPDLISCPLWPLIHAHHYAMLPLTETELRSAISGPAANLGVRVEAALVERLLADLAGEPGCLPLLQETLLLLWDHRDDGQLSLPAYTKMHRTDNSSLHSCTLLQFALAQRADMVLSSLSPQQQQITRQILLRLVQFGQGRPDTRRQQTVAHLQSRECSRSELRMILDRLAEHRLVILGGAATVPDPLVDLAHEALITSWPPFQHWLSVWGEGEQMRRRLEGKAEEWLRLGRGHGGLLDAVELPEVVHWLEGTEAQAVGWSDDLDALVQASEVTLGYRQQQEAQYKQQREAAAGGPVHRMRSRRRQQPDARTAAVRQRAAVHRVGMGKHE